MSNPAHEHGHEPNPHDEPSWYAKYDEHYGKLPDLVSSGDIARMAKVTPAAVPNWRTRYNSPNPANNPNQIPKFPDPVVVTGAGPLYAKREIEAWLRARKERQTNT